jgi:cell division cycle 2-like
MLQLLSGVNHMHQRWFIHRDLKTSNLLYSNKGKLAICDFGMARKYGRYSDPPIPFDGFLIEQ